MDFKNDLAFAGDLDTKDVLHRFRSQFHFPQHHHKPMLYFTGNSLGLQPKKAAQYINQELSDWATMGVEAHFKPDTGWFSYHELLRDSTARLVGALPAEVTVMNHLTVNLHLLMVSFYRPDKKRFKIICEASAFPSDRYALQSQIKAHGLDPATALVELHPRKGEDTLRIADVFSAINENSDSLALVMLGGVNYYTGQIFPMKEIAAAAHKVGALAGFDLAHAAGNIKMSLHDWDVDFACWCSYKYLNAGPGGVGGVFIHQRHVENTELPRFAGWWGNDPRTRFTMPHDFVPVKSADAWQLSNAPILNMAALRASMELFDEAGMEALTAKSFQLTSYLLYIVKDVVKQCGDDTLVRILTPFEEQKQGCQLSLVVKNGRKVFDYITAHGVVTDWREPDVIRVAPVPLYNSFEDIYNFGVILKSAFESKK
jgi:kynureninase